MLSAVRGKSVPVVGIQVAVYLLKHTFGTSGIVIRQSAAPWHHADPQMCQLADFGGGIEIDLSCYIFFISWRFIA